MTTSVSHISRIAVLWGLIAGSAPAQQLTVATDFQAGKPLIVTAGAESPPIVATLTSNTADTAPEDFLTGWQLVLSVVPDAGAAGTLVFEAASQPEVDYVFSEASSLGAAVVNSGHELLAFDANFPFSGGVEVPSSTMASLLKLSFLFSPEAVGGFGLYALAGPGNSEWTDARQPVAARREFDNIREGSGPARIADIVVVRLPGDFNGDGFVDGADYTVWRDNLGAPAGALLNDTTSSVIGAEQYTLWRTNYGAASRTDGLASSRSTTLPEPTSLALLGMGWAAVTWRPRKKAHAPC